ncbi:sulfatase-like hydrolase/transferase, partial [Escherichia coli]|nr:sulfatase-like hydrolase/transferase [Escherichia coli]
MRNQIKVKSDINKYIACYVSSIKQTDEFLKSVYETMSQSENVKKFSIIYFSDHGMVHREMNGRIYLNNNYV